MGDVQNRFALASGSLGAATFDFPDTDGDTGSIALSDGHGWAKSLDSTVVVKVANTTDQSATVTLRGTTGDDPAMDADTADDSSTTDVTVAAGETAALDTATPWSYLRVTATFSTAPASGDLAVVYQEAP